MAAGVGIFIVAAFVTELSLVTAYTPSYRYMKTYCGGSVDTVTFNKDVVVEWDRYSTSLRTTSCQVQFINADSTRLVQAGFRYLNIPARKSDSCSKVGLVLADGASPLTPPNGVCGTKLPHTRYRTQGSQLTLTIHNNGGATFADFEVLLSSFYYPPDNKSCDDGDFKCNNGLCISDALTCNGYNDCGDDSDEVEGCSLAAGVIVGIVFGVIIFVVLCSVFGICVRRRRRSYIRVTETVREYPTVQAVPAGAYVPSYASQPGRYQAI